MPLSDESLNLIALALCLKSKKKSSKRSKWSKGWLLKRKELSHSNLLKELRLEPSDWLNYLRMDESTYFELLELVTPIIQRQDTIMREAISPHERLSATLRFLACGMSYEDLKLSTAISAQALGKIIPDTCNAIYTVLNTEYLKFPASEHEWKEIGKQFENVWQFPNCLGCVDGKHIRITPPPESGSYFLNYKGFNSMVLMAIANANYEFILCDIGTNGKVSDGEVIENTTFHDKLVNGELRLPAPRKAKNSAFELPYVFIGDEAFSLRSDFLKPFNQKELNYERKIFNYRLSRARRILENTFGIMAARFRIFHTSINLRLDRIEVVVMTCAVLHNFLRRKCAESYSPPDCFDSEDVSNARVIAGLEPDPEVLIGLQRGNNGQYGQEAKEVREFYTKYFNGDGKVDWQERMI